MSVFKVVEIATGELTTWQMRMDTSKADFILTSWHFSSHKHHHSLAATYRDQHSLDLSQAAS